MNKRTNNHLSEANNRLTFLTTQLENDIQTKTVQLESLLSSAKKQREEDLSTLRKELDRWERSRPAQDASEDRLRTYTTWIRPLTYGEQEIQRLRGSLLIQLLIQVLAFLHVPFVTRFARQRTRSIRALREQEQELWYRTIRSLRERIDAAEKALTFPLECPQERELRREITALKISLQRYREEQREIQAHLFARKHLP